MPSCPLCDERLELSRLDLIYTMPANKGK